MLTRSRSENALRLSEAVIRDLPFTMAGQRYVHDAELPGFFVRVGTRRKSYSVQADLRRHGRKVRTVKLKIGDVDQMPLRKARAEAQRILGEIKKGRDPAEGEQRRGAVTLRSAWEDYERALRARNRAEKTIAGYLDCIERLLKEWIDLPLHVLGSDPRMVEQKHRQITERSGPYAANAAMRTLRAVYRHQRRLDRSLPEHPVDAVTFNRESRRDTGMGLARLADWNTQRVALPNPVRREFHLFNLLSGHRPAALCEARWEHLDVRGRRLHVPRPKGGAKRAFDLPLSRAMLLCLARARRAGRMLHPAAASEWIFPSATGHMVEYKERRARLSHWGGDLRQTYATVATGIGIPHRKLKLLMNHLTRDVTDGYTTASELHFDLVQQQERLSAAMFAALR